MLSNKPLEVNCYQIRGILKNRQSINQKGIQNAPYFVSQGVSPYSYEYESKNIATTAKYGDKIKNENVKHYCKCKLKLGNDQSLNESYYNDVSQVNKRKRFNLFSKKRGSYTVNPIKKSLISLYRKRKNTVESNHIKHINTDNTKKRKKKQKNRQVIEDSKLNTIENKKGNAKPIIKNKAKAQQYQITFRDNKTMAENVCVEGICRVNAGKGKRHRCMCGRNNEVYKSEKEKHGGKKSKSDRKNADIFNDYITYPMTVKRNKFNECLCQEYVGPRKKNLFNECLCKDSIVPNKNSFFNECLCKAYKGSHKYNLNECLCKVHNIDSPKNNRFSERLRKADTDSPKKNVLSDRRRKVYTEVDKNYNFNTDANRTVQNECLCKSYKGANKTVQNECLCKSYKGANKTVQNECLCKSYKGANKTDQNECLCKVYSNSFSDYLRKFYKVTIGKNDCFCKEPQAPTANNVLRKRLRKAYTVSKGKNIFKNNFINEYGAPPNKVGKRDHRTKPYTEPKNKSLIKDTCLCKKDTIIKQLARLGAGDQLLKSECTKKCRNVISGIFKHNNVPRELIVDRKPKPPLFAIRVDSSNMEVINSDEIKGKVHTFGKIGKNESCVCPSRLQNEKYYGIGDTCEAGICELAGKDKYNRFNCKCAKKTLIKCSDTTCDQQTVYAKPNEERNIRTVTTNKPLFKMVLDSNQMNILNTGEIEDILEKASHTDKCETGICSRFAGNKRTILECTCINKKIMPPSLECDEKTCRPKKSKFYILCSRIFSGSTFGSRGRHTYHPNRRQALVLGTTTSPGQANTPRPVPTQGQRIPAATLGQRKPMNGPHMVMTGGRAGQLTNKNDMDCMCYCQCKEEMKARKAKDRAKTKSKAKNKAKQVKRSRIFRRKQITKNLLKTQKEFTKLQKKKAREERKKERMEQKLEEKKRMEIHKLAMKEAGEGNFLTNLVIGLMNITLQSINGIFRALISILFSPFRSYLYAKNKIKDPIGTAKTFKRWFLRTWKSKESKFSRNIRESDTLNVLADHLEESVIFRTFANKGQTQTERTIYERKSKLRQRRMQKRKNQALYGCRHVLLTTLRKHPCLWVYHVCPGFYPQCLSLMAMCGNFVHLLLFLGALLCWTPCIIMMELVRGCFCCMLCTQ